MSANLVGSNGRFGETYCLNFSVTTYYNLGHHNSDNNSKIFHPFLIFIDETRFFKMFYEAKIR